MDEKSPVRHSKGRKGRAAGRMLKKSGRPEMNAIPTHAGEAALATGRPRLSQETQNRIGEQLRALYNHIVEEPLPEHLRELLKRLRSGG